MELKEWHGYAQRFKDVLGLGLDPVAVSCIDAQEVDIGQEKARICRSILDAASGKLILVAKHTNACFGAMWHLGFMRIKDPKTLNMIRQFVVEGEKLFSSYEALDTLVSQMDEVPDNAKKCFVLSPLANAQYTPELIIFVCNPEQACRLLTLVTFYDGVMPKIKIGGPTCRMAVMYPLFSGEVNISFQDSTARKMCAMDKNLLFVSIPAKKIPQIVESIDKCSAGRAKIEYPQGFREFLQKRKSQSNHA